MLEIRRRFEMALYCYFKNNADAMLPDPRGPLSKQVHVHVPSTSTTYAHRDVRRSGNERSAVYEWAWLTAIHNP